MNIFVCENIKSICNVRISHHYFCLGDYGDFAPPFTTSLSHLLAADWEMSGPKRQSKGAAKRAPKPSYTPLLDAENLAATTPSGPIDDW